MARFLGVEGGHTANVGLFNPPVHRGVDVFAPPGSGLYVPRNTTMTVNGSSFDASYYKGQAWGWLTMCGTRYGFIVAHLGAKPFPKTYVSGEKLGYVSGGVRFTPHIHWALSPDHIPPPGTVDPVKVWKACVASGREEEG